MDCLINDSLKVKAVTDTSCDVGLPGSGLHLLSNSKTLCVQNPRVQGAWLLFKRSLQADSANYNGIRWSRTVATPLQ
jgi:hypothetical protein